jgi:GNAT superfamily N-acetyltransferase
MVARCATIADVPVGEPPSGLVVRPLGPSDSIAALTDLLHRAYAGRARQGLRYVATHQDDETTRRRIAGGQCLVATLESRLVGTITFVPKQRTGGCAWYDRTHVARFEQLGVDPALHGHGVGSLLVDLVEERAWATGASEIALDTSDRAGDLLAWYRRRGYRAVEEVDWDATNYRSVVLSKRLALPSAGMHAALGARASCLVAMLVESVNWDPARPRLAGREVLARPQLRRYVDGWGRTGDVGIVAEDDAGSALGAAWFRRFTTEEPGFAFLAEEIPEVSVAVRRPWRGHGLGTRLLAELEAEARRLGVRALSLSVEPANPALRLYRRLGYHPVSTYGGSWTLRRDLVSDR